MKKYNVPTLEIKDFEKENIAVTNSIVQPGDATGYKSADENVSIQDTTCVLKWVL